MRAWRTRSRDTMMRSSGRASLSTGIIFCMDCLSAAQCSAASRQIDRVPDHPAAVMFAEAEDNTEGVGARAAQPGLNDVVMLDAGRGEDFVMVVGTGPNCRGDVRNVGL